MATLIRRITGTLCLVLAVACACYAFAVRNTHSGTSFWIVWLAFAVSPEARGMGVGRKLFNHMLDVFRDAGMNEYFLFTDTTCDYGFYDYRGLTRKAERTIRRDSFTQGGLEDGSLSFFLYEGRC